MNFHTYIHVPTKITRNFSVIVWTGSWGWKDFATWTGDRASLLEMYIHEVMRKVFI